MDPRATVDTTANSYIRDVVGNKSDAATVPTAIGTTKSIMAYIKALLTAIGFVADAAVNSVGATSTLMSYVKALVAGSALAQGSTFTVVKTLVSSAILQAGVDITLPSTGGALEIVQIVVQTNVTGLAGGTNFTIVHNNVSGLLAFFSQAVSGLGANKTVSLVDAATTKVISMLESGKKLTAKATVADCTGAGTIDVYITFRRTVAGANVVAA